MEFGAGCSVEDRKRITVCQCVRVCVGVNAKSGTAGQEVLMAEVNKVKAWRGCCSEMDTNEELSLNSTRGLVQKLETAALYSISSRSYRSMEICCGKCQMLFSLVMEKVMIQYRHLKLSSYSSAVCNFNT